MVSFLSSPGSALDSPWLPEGFGSCPICHKVSNSNRVLINPDEKEASVNTIMILYRLDVLTAVVIRKGETWGIRLYTMMVWTRAKQSAAWIQD
eukprot:4058356-Ditylum_brightwellii.AAC.1